MKRIAVLLHLFNAFCKIFLDRFLWLWDNKIFWTSKWCKVKGILFFFPIYLILCHIFLGVFGFVWFFVFCLYVYRCVSLKCLNRHKKIVSFPFCIMDQFFRILSARMCQNFLCQHTYFSGLMNYSLHLHDDQLCQTYTNDCAINAPAGSHSPRYHGNGCKVTASVEEDGFWRQSPWW